MRQSAARGHNAYPSQIVTFERAAALPILLVALAREALTFRIQIYDLRDALVTVQLVWKSTREVHEQLSMGDGGGHFANQNFDEPVRAVATVPNLMRKETAIAERPQQVI